MLKKMLLAVALATMAIPVLAAGPRTLSILINDTPFSGKAVWYKERVYVSLEDLAKSMGAQYTHDAKTGTVRVRMPAVVQAVGGAAPTRPYVTVTMKQKYVFPGNAKVLATFKNGGDAPARAVEAICVWKDGRLQPINADLRLLGDLAPGESRTAEFYLYPSGGYVTPYAYSSFYAGFGIVDDDKISINGTLQPVSYDFKLNYAGKPETERQ